MRRILFSLCLLVCLGAASTQASAAVVPVSMIEGVSYAYWSPPGRDATTFRFSRVDAFDIAPGTRLTVACGIPESCPFAPEEQTADSSRKLSLHSFKDVDMTRETQFQVTLTATDGRSQQITAWLQDGHLKTRELCRLGDGTESPCVVKCSTAPPTPTTGPCAGVKRPLRMMSKSIGVRWNVTWSKRGSTRFSRFLLHDLPPGTSAMLICRDPETGRTACKKPVAYAPPRDLKSDIDFTSELRGRSIPAGMRVTIRLSKPGYRVQQLRFTTRRDQEPRRQRMCVDPGKRPASC